MKEPDEEKGACQGERPDASQKKTKNKKKKNKKKKSPAPVEAKDVQEELTLQSPDLSDGREDEQVKCADEKPGAEAQNGVPENPQQNEVAGSRADGRSPEDPHAEPERNPPALMRMRTRRQRSLAPRGTRGTVKLMQFRHRAPAPVVKARTKGSPKRRLLSKTPPLLAASRVQRRTTWRAALRSKTRAPRGTGRTPLKWKTQKIQVRRSGGSESLSLEGEGLAPAGELEGLDAECKDERRGGNGKGRSKDECALS